MKFTRRHILPMMALTVLSGALCTGCKEEKQQTTTKAPDNCLVSVGDSVLTVERVVQKIPPGLSMADSAAMFDAIVEDWLRERLLCDIAAGNLPHPELIEQRVRDYRNRLIALEYRKLMGDNSIKEASEDSVKAYYERNRENMTLTAPLIRGLYIKVPTNDSQIENIRQWINTANPQSIDKLEKHGLKNAMQYDHFTDRWVDWQTVAEQIPFRFGNADDFLAKDKVFETEQNGNTYLLHVTDVLHTGEEMPYEFASTQIRSMMADRDRASYDDKLTRDLYNKAVKDKRIVDNRKRY